MNLVIISGRLTAEPEVKSTASGVNYCDFTLANNRGKDSNGQDKGADFVRCRAWRQTADLIKTYFHKGDGFTVQGSLRVDKVEDKGIYTTVNVERIDFPLTRKGAATEQPAEQAPLAAAFDDIELPF